MSEREQAAAQFMAWRKQGVPVLVTRAEAYRLTDGKVGKQDDHGKPVNLATLAARYVKAQRGTV